MEIISLFVSVSAMILKYILKKQTSKFITDKVEFKYALTQSLNNSYNALIESELVCFDGEGAIDHSFFKDERSGSCSICFAIRNSE